MNITIFDEIIDERKLGEIWYDLQDILTISFFVVRSGAEDYEVISEHGRQMEKVTKELLYLNYWNK